LDEALGTWFKIEEEFRKDPNTSLEVNQHLGDPWIANAAELMRLALGRAADWSAVQLRRYLERLPETDLSAAAYEHLGRKLPELLQDIPQPKIARFIAQYTADQAPAVDESQAKTYLKRLHAQKDACYGNAWKKRGEMTSILANVARKVDRIEEFMKKGAVIDGESITDTAVDLFVYLTKYRLFLLEQAPALAAGVLPASSPTPCSDHVVNFEALVDGTVAADTGVLSAVEVARDLVTGFAALHALAERGANPAAKLAAVSELAGRSLRYYFLLAEQHGVPA
jgi:thymidylate synthase